jgi:hypothetical protein
LAIARRLVDALAEGIEERSLPWQQKFRKGYVAFQRIGGYNVAAVDLMWNKPVRVWIKLPRPPEDIADLENPYPQLSPIWVAQFSEWGWHIPSAEDIPDVAPLLDLAERLSSS